MSQLHATTIAMGGRGLLVLGGSGAGKSTLALQMMAVGAMLVADDRTDVHVRAGQLYASAPAVLSGRIEARGIGILTADTVAEASIAVVLDLGQAEDARLPPRRWIEIEGIRLPLVLGPFQPHLYAAMRQLLLSGWAC